MWTVGDIILDIFRVTGWWVLKLRVLSSVEVKEWIPLIINDRWSYGHTSIPQRECVEWKLIVISIMAQQVKKLPEMQETQETWVRSLGPEDPLEEEIATHSSILTWKIPWTEEPGGLQSKGSQRVGPDRATKHTNTQWENGMCSLGTLNTIDRINGSKQGVVRNIAFSKSEKTECQEGADIT